MTPENFEKGRTVCVRRLEKYYSIRTLRVLPSGIALAEEKDLQTRHVIKAVILKSHPWPVICDLGLSSDYGNRSVWDL